jgi:hypothetical protein
MFNRQPRAMLVSGHLHQCEKGLSCSRVLLQHTAANRAQSQPIQSGPRPEARARVCRVDTSVDAFSPRSVSLTASGECLE